jgi:hypothetical protein
LTWVSGSFFAHVMAARLRFEGIDVQLRGALDGPYGLTVGDMARVDLWVPEDQLDDARLVMLASEVDVALAAPREWAGDEATPGWHWPMWVVLVLVALAGLAPIVHYLTDW